MANDNQRGNYWDFDEQGRQINGNWPWASRPTTQNPRVVNPTPAVRPAVQPSAPATQNPRVVNPNPGAFSPNTRPGNTDYIPTHYPENHDPNAAQAQMSPFYTGWRNGVFYSNGRPSSPGGQQQTWNPMQWGGFGMQSPFSGMSQMPNVGGFFGGSGLMSMLMNLMSSMPTSMMFPPTTASYNPAGPLVVYGSGASGGGAYQPNYGGYSGLMSMFM